MMEARVLHTIRLEEDCPTAVLSHKASAPSAQFRHAVSTMTHDLGNRLQMVSSVLNALSRKARAGDLEGMEGLVVQAQDCVTAAGQLGHQLWTDMPVDLDKDRQIEVGDLIDAMLPILQLTVGESIRVTTLADNARRMTSCNQHDLENALLNLIINARDALMTGGDIRIEVASRPLRASAFASNHSHLSITVRDDGCGMTKDQLAKACEIGFTTKSSNNGRGLGLASVKKFASECDGWLELESTLGLGTAISIILPAL